MFVSDQRMLAASFAAAAPRLARLAHGGWLRAVSEDAYAGGVEYLVRVGPLGAVPGASRLVRVRFTEPFDRNGTVSVGLRWEATGVTGGLFPALDADIRLTDDQPAAQVTLTGSYRPPLGVFGAELDRLLLRTVATATIRTLLNEIAAALEGDVPKAGRPDGIRLPGPGPAPAPR